MIDFQSLSLFPNLAVMVLCIIIASLSSCDPNNHEPSDHPCNFPDVETENNLGSPRSYKIIDKETYEGLVGIDSESRILLEDVRLYDDELIEIPPANQNLLNQWIHENLEVYRGVPFNDPKALLELEYKVFYLKTSNVDYDTIEVYFENCLAAKVTFNGQSTQRPFNDPFDEVAGYYFPK